LTTAKCEAHIMLMTMDTFELLRYRRKEIAAEAHDLRERIEALKADIDVLEAEDNELAGAERVLSRFGVPPPETSQVTPEATGGKPPGTPTTPNMIVALLREATSQGKPGLEPRDMMMSISRRWWPSVKSEDIGPTAWRMWKEGRLHKEGSLYMLRKNTEAADDLLRGTAASE
jgi:hypothetical protein